MNPRSISVALLVALLFALAHREGPEPSVAAKIAAAVVAGTLGLLSYLFWRDKPRSSLRDDPE